LVLGPFENLTNLGPDPLVKDKEEAEKHLFKKSQAEHFLHQEDEQRQEREAPKTNSIGKLRQKSIV
jgi:hypothetical protein